MLHSPLEVSNVLAIVIDVPVNRLLSNDPKPHPFVFHVVRKLRATQRISLPNFVQLDGVAPTAHFLAVLSSINVVANPPNA
ncbi:hypothetical protein [Tunturiibacter lichenicola]|uniref:hypothetical protein n=1 Tax=Tunturiibacter lichenicola TaxID=2051959 RepID=UPI0021B24136|nr:hypothetical protein [Edaphobacter lichenicola]